MAARHPPLVGGMCETDYSGYPDCRDNTIKALQVALNLGMDRSFALQTPLMWLDKAETWRWPASWAARADRHPARAHPHLLSAERGPLHDWGHGCGDCPACALRKRGFEMWKKGSSGYRNSCSFRTASFQLAHEA